MGAWLPFILTAIKALAELVSYLGERKLIEAGKAQALADGLSQTLNNVEKANAAARAVDSGSPDFDPDWADIVRSRFERKQGD